MHKGRIISVLVLAAVLAGGFWWSTSRSTPTAAPAPAKRAELGPLAFGILPVIDDRFVQEPCSRVVGGGLSAVSALYMDIEKRFPGSIRIAMGDFTNAWGEYGCRTASYHFDEVMPMTGIRYLAAGEGELGLGIDFLREVLTVTQGPTLVCANAADEEGQTFLKGYVLLRAQEHGVLLVGVASESLQTEIARRGSKVKLLSAQDGAASALAAGLADAARINLEVDAPVLLVHGTVAETAAILEKVPGFSLAVAAHGGLLPDQEPRRVGGVPILYGGRGLRFAWRALRDAKSSAPLVSLVRIGYEASSGPSPYAEGLRYFRQIATDSMFAEGVAAGRVPDPRGRYVGAKRCSECHAEIAAAHAASPHGAPSPAVLDSDFAASSQCMACHVTAPYSDGGWRGPKDRSDLAAISCEACHGPGEAHAAAKSKGYGRMELSRCYDCHLPDRSPGFDAEASWKAAPHRLR